MIEQHYTDEALLSLLDTCGSDTLLGDPHLAACATCADALESYRDLAGLLCEKEVWDEEDEVLESAPVPETLSRIRAFADAAAREDAEAVELVNELLDMPAEWWAEEVRHDERYHTAGVVRRLVAVAHEAIDSIPLQGLALTDVAVSLVEKLDSAKYSLESRELLRGVAWREHGWALTYLGRDNEAIIATEKAATALDHCVGAEVEIARNRILMSLIERQLERFDAAIASARSAATIFETYGLNERRRAANWAETAVLMATGRYREAIDSFRKLESEVGNRPGELAGIILNTALCYSEMREFDRALPQYRFALGVYEDIGNRSEAARVNSLIAAAYAAKGDVAEAEKRYRAVRPHLAALGMSRDAALVDLGLAEVVIAQKRFAEAESMCRQVISYFESITEPYSSQALAALSYLREAVEQRKANAAAAEAVRRYIGRLPQQPSLLFAPPPLP